MPNGPTLIDYLDSGSVDSMVIGVQSAVAGGRMKEISTDYWTSPNTGADNESGFTGLPGGYREVQGEMYGIGTCTTAMLCIVSAMRRG